MKSKIISLTLAFMLVFNVVAFAGVNKQPFIDNMVVNKQHDKIDEYIRQETKAEKTVSTLIEIDENNILGPAYKDILGHGTEAFNFVGELCLDENGEVTEEWQKFCDEEFYDAPLARFGGGACNGYSLLGQIGPVSERKVATWLLSEEDTKLFHPEAVHSLAYGSTNVTLTCGTVEWIQAMQAQNPDISFIFAVSVSHCTTEEIINFARFCLDDPGVSYWGDLRESYGIKKLNVLAFEAGNEVYINNCNYEISWFADRVSWYARRFNEIYDALSQVFPDLPLAPSLSGDYWAQGTRGGVGAEMRDRWHRPLLKAIGKDRLKYLSIHLYYGGYEPAYCCDAYDYLYEICNELFGEGHGLQLLVTEHAKWASGTQWTTAATLESALTTAQYLNYLYGIPNQWIRAANYYAFTSNMWAQVRRNYDGTLTASSVGKMYDIYLDKLGDRVVSTTSIPQDDSGLCDKELTSARFSAQAFAKDKNKLTVVLTNRVEDTAIDIQFKFLKNNYKLVEETVFTAPHTLSFIYDERSLDLFTTTSTKKNEANFSHYVMPNHSMVVLEFEATNGTIPSWGDEGGDDGVVTYDGEPHFTDTEYHWADAEINLLAQEKLVSGKGDGTFAPDSKISKAEFSAMLCKVLGTDTGLASVLNDVSTGDWYYNYVNTVINRGYLKADGYFNPNGEITLKDALTALYRVCSAKKNDVEVENASEYVKGMGITLSLTDWEKEAMAYLCVNNFVTEFYEVTDIGLTQGLTRAEAAALIYRLKTNLGITIETEEV